MRHLLVLSLCLTSLTASRPASAKADLDTAPLHVEFKVEAGEGKSLIASGAMDMEAEEMTQLELSQPGPERSKLELSLYGRIHHDGSIAIWANYEEESRVGEAINKVKWQPAMQGKRGVPLTAVIRSGKVERMITVVVR